MKKLALILTLALLLVALTAGMALALVEYCVGNELIEVDEPKSGDGWEWDGKDLTLTDFKYDGQTIDGRLHVPVIMVPDDTTIFLKGKNVIDFDAPDDPDDPYKQEDEYTCAIACSGELTIKGPGSLKAVVAITGIYANEGLDILDGAELHIILKPSAEQAFPSGNNTVIGLEMENVSPNNNPLNIRDSVVKIEADGSNLDLDDNEWKAFYFQSRGITSEEKQKATPKKAYTPSIGLFGMLLNGPTEIDNSEINIDLKKPDWAASYGIMGNIVTSADDHYLRIVNDSQVKIKANLGGIGINKDYSGYVITNALFIQNSVVEALVLEELPSGATLIRMFRGSSSSMFGCGIYTEGHISIDNSSVDASGFFVGIIAIGELSDDLEDLLGPDAPAYILADLPFSDITLSGVTVTRGGRAVPLYFTIYNIETADNDNDADELEMKMPKFEVLGELRLGTSFAKGVDRVNFYDQIEMIKVQRKLIKELIEEYGQNFRDKMTDDELMELEIKMVEASFGDMSTYVKIRSSREMLQTTAPMLMAVGKSFPFIDVTEQHWARPYVEQAYKQALINGKTDVLYMPDGNLTYAEAIKLASCINQLYSMGAVSFEPGYPWYQPYVSYAELNQIIQPGEFAAKLDDPISRYDFAHIFSHALPDSAFTPLKAIDSIPDVPSSNEHAGEVLKLYRAGILTGDTTGAFNGKDKIKRSETAAIVIRMIDNNARVVK